MSVVHRGLGAVGAFWDDYVTAIYECEESLSAQDLMPRMQDSYFSEIYLNGEKVSSPNGVTLKAGRNVLRFRTNKAENYTGYGKWTAEADELLPISTFWAGRSDIRTILLPERIHYIGMNALRTTTSLEAIYMAAKVVINPFNGSTFFEDASLTAIYVPAALVEAYKADDYWKIYASKFLPM